MKAILFSQTLASAWQKADPRSENPSWNDDTVIVAVENLTVLRLGRSKDPNRENTITVCRVIDPHLSQLNLVQLKRECR